jgi:hypothetical protein
VTQDKIDALTKDLASAMVLIDNVKAVAYSELGYDRTRHAAGRAAQAISDMLVALQEDWEQDERELDEGIENFTTSWSKERS